MLSTIRKMSTPSRIPNLNIHLDTCTKEIFEKYKENYKKTAKRTSYSNMYSGLIEKNKYILKK